MSELHAIAEITKLETAKQRRGVRKGRLTRLRKQLEEFQHTALQDLQAHQLKQLADDFKREQQIFAALQHRYEQLLELTEGVTEGQLSNEFEAGIEAADHHNQLIRTTELLNTVYLHYLEAQSIQTDYDRFIETADSSLPEFETDCKNLQSKLSTFQRTIATFKESELATIRKTFTQREEDLARRLTESRSSRREYKTPEPAPTSSTTPRGPKIKLDLPKFSGQPTDWRHFHRLFTSALDTRGSTFSQHEKVCLLLQAMQNPESQQIVQSYSHADDGYDQAMDALTTKYGSARKVFPILVRKTLEKSSIDFTEEGFQRLRQRFLIPFQAMKDCGCDTLSHYLAVLACEDFTPRLREEWTKHLSTSTAVPTLDDLFKYTKPLEHTLSSITLSSSSSSRPTSTSSKSASNPQRKAASDSQRQCGLCHEDHRLFHCPVFLGYDPVRRKKYVNEKKGCVNCLSLGHRINDCASQHRCRKCDGRHNTLLHKDREEAATQPLATNFMTIPQSTPEEHAAEPPKDAFLHTALANAIYQGRESQVRVAIDTGATSSLISEGLASNLHLKRHPRRLQITGACGNGVSKHFVKLTLQSLHDDQQTLTTKFSVVKNLPAAPSPSNNHQVKNEPHLQGLQLADPHFGGSLDILIGGLDCSQCILGSLVQRQNSNVAAQPTIFGWTVMGPLDYTPSTSSILQLNTHEDHLSEDLSRLWELDKTPESSSMSTADEEVIENFKDTHSRDEDGRYIVKLPRVPNPPELGASRRLALRRFIQNEKSLRQKGKLDTFTASIEEYFTLDHAEVVPAKDLDNDHYYLPVHAVYKPSSTSTKVRPVFDGSARTTSGISFNETLSSGPNLYPLLTDIVLHFRIHRIGLTADIGKMFREIKLHTTERDFHRFLFRNSHGQITDARMKRLTFGIRSSPYLATQVIRDLAERHQSSHPVASYMIGNSFYVDDFVAGANDIPEAQHIQHELCDLLNKAGMNLRKWRTNDASLRNAMPPDSIEMEDLHLSTSDRSIKALGIHWRVSDDTLHVATPEVESTTPTTKRVMASVIGKVYDILGWFAPYTISAKILLRKAWTLQLPWDEPLPEELQQLWIAWTSELSQVTTHPIDRRYSTNNSNILSQSLHGFADASQEAYGAVVYLLTQHADSTTTSSIVLAKSRVMPLKALTIPRAELTAAYLLAKLLRYVSNQLQIHDITAWSDSSVTLCWLRKSPSSLKTFVSNRVNQINRLLPDVQWRHVSSSFNPADSLSRGVTASQLHTSDLWWHGPPWLTQPKELWPMPQFHHPAELPEVRSVVLLAPTKPEACFWDSYSSYSHLIRIYAWVRRFLQNCRLKAEQRILQSTISVEECKKTSTVLLALAQQQSYSEVVQAAKKGHPLPRSHPLYGYNLKLDDDGILHIQGRLRDLRNTKEPQQLTPLSLQSSFTRLIITSAHRKYLHAGIGTLMAILGHSYHIPGLRKFLKRLSKQCPQCQRAYSRTTQQQMGLLPSCRTTPSPPFSVTGLDFAGPFTIRQGHTRRPVLLKCYACLFICMATKAIHIELCAGLDTEEFLAAFRRFCSRRGTPSKVHSDNGSNFVGAYNEIMEIQLLVSTSRQKLSHLCSSNDIQWSFIPPVSPHFGGIWESGVKLMKTLIRKNITPHPLQFHQLNSLLIEIEAILNSRPITPLHSTDNPEEVLTPGHFIIGRPISAPPTAPPTQEKWSSLQRWQLVQRLSQDIWTAWINVYRQQLLERRKWKSGNHIFKLGDLVFLKEESFGYRRWPLARVSAVFPGDDGIIRAVEVICQGKKWRRSVDHLIPIEFESSNQDLRNAQDSETSSSPVCSGLTFNARPNKELQLY